MHHKKIKIFSFIMAATLATLLSAGAEVFPITITQPAGPMVFREADEFAGMIAGKAWDMSDLYDITFRGRFYEPYTPPADGIWSGTYYGEDLPGHYWPLFRGWISTPNYLQYFTRHSPGTPYGPLNPLDADYFNRLSIRHALAAEKRSYFDTVWFRTLLDTENNIFRFTDGDLARRDGSSTFVPHPSGFRIHDIDLTGATFDQDRIPNISGPPVMHGTWDGTLYGFYLDPSHLARGGTEYALDWIRLYHSDEDTRMPLTWTSGYPEDPAEHVSMRLFVATNNVDDPGTLFLTGILNDGEMTFQTGALPSGDYYLYLQAVEDIGTGFNVLGRSDYSPRIRINARPTFEFTSPSFTSGVDYATVDRGNPWNMSCTEDINNEHSANITDVIVSDGILRATNTSDDPYVGLSLRNNRGVHVPISPMNYRYLTFRMNYDTSAYPSPDFPSPDARTYQIGAVARLQWAYTDTSIDGSYTKDIILLEGWHEYTVDLWDDALLETRDYHLPNLGWTAVPEINYFIFHPMEPSVPIRFELDYIKICAPNTPANNVFPIRWVSGDADGDKLDITLLYGTGTGETFAGTTIATLANQTPGTGEYQWHTHNVPPGEYTVRAVISDGLNMLVRDSLVPVIISGQGAVIRANGTTGTLDINHGEQLDITVEFHLGSMAPANADWWAVAWDMTRNNWYYCVSPNVWEWFNGNLSQCRPAYRGPLQNLPPTRILTGFEPHPGVYRVYFATDPMDGTINYPDGFFGFDFVTVNVN